VRQLAVLVALTVAALGRLSIRPDLRTVGHAALAGLVTTAFAVGFAVGGVATPVEAKATPEAASKVDDIGRTASTLGVDLDGDGRLDVARPIARPVRGVDAYGSGAFGATRDGGRRRHGGVDFIAWPGETVRAPIAGVVTRIGAAYTGKSGLSYVEITDPASRYTARVLYIGPTVQIGTAIAAGDVIGRAQDLAGRYPGGMTNHVHVELSGRGSGRLNPLDVLPAATRPAAHAA
jgi:murein DD-endopeptidase MepM/ murein hydrolase activator NlpD